MEDNPIMVDPRIEIIALKMAQWDANEHGYPVARDLDSLEEAARDYYIHLARIAVEGM